MRVVLKLFTVQLSMGGKHRELWDSGDNWEIVWGMLLWSFPRFMCWV